jgi:hypothetical protein
MSKHTPGPWTATSRRVTAPETEDRLGLDVHIYGGNGQDNAANARLIAAAPDLLEALKMGYADTMDYIQLNKLGAENNHWLVLARAAIAKATGEQA